MDRTQKQPTYDFEFPDAEERLGELIVYVAQKAETDPFFGATMLNKILFYADFWTYAFYGRPITGVEYRAREFGPAPHRLLPVKHQLQQRRDIDLVEVPRRHGVQTRIIALRPANTARFTDKELRVVDAVINLFAGMPAKDVSAMSHGLAWQCTPRDEPIPYESAWVSDAEITDEDREWATRTLKELGRDV